MTRGGILAIIPKTIYTNENITKIPTPSPISHYLQAILINNKPITPILLLNMYMPSHPHDVHLIQNIQSELQKITHNHQNHHIILAGDFNRDILLKVRSSNGITSPPNKDDYEWAHFTSTLGLQPINNLEQFTRQGGHNYTSTSHIDGFYSNKNTLQSYTITNFNQNSDHYPVQLQLPTNSIVLKEIKTTPTNPRIIYPIPPH